MRIGAMTDYSSILQNYRVPEIPSVSLDEVKLQDQRKALENTASPAASPLSEQTRPRRDAALEDISLGGQKEFGYIGKDSDLLALDRDGIASENQKDQLLQQYRFFAGTQSSALVDNSDGVVVAKPF
ncbi:MAG: hypothetical protein K5891_03345 [Lachnospiraceae bacterium]|nr:hypothetical protein [Lachnospiraceae bacterium]